MSSVAQLDVRVPIGAMFVADGALLVIYGAVARPTTEAAERFGGNINLLWGFVLLTFGLGMLGWRLASKQREPSRDPSRDH